MGVLHMILGGDHQTVGDFAASAGGGGDADKAGRRLHGGGEIRVAQNGSLVKAHHVDGFSGIHAAAAAYGDHRVTGLPMAQGSCLLRHVYRGIDGDFAVKVVGNVRLLQKVGNFVRNAHVNDALVADDKCFFDTDLG